MPGFFTGFVTFLMAAVIIFLSYVCSKYMGKGLVRASSSRYMRMLDQMIVGQNRTLAVVQAGAVPPPAGGAPGSDRDASGAFRGGSHPHRGRGRRTDGGFWPASVQNRAEKGRGVMR